MSVVVEYKGELFSLIVDEVGEVSLLSPSKIEKNTSNMSTAWQDVSAGVYKLDRRLMIVLNIPKLLDY